MRELALFAGAGGGILGGKLLGWRTCCAVEIDPYCRSVLLARQRDGMLDPFPIWDDVRTFDGTRWSGHVDVVSGGFPCQDISAAGKGAGIDGERSGLWVEMARIIREVRPRFAFVENSPMLTSRGLGTVLGDLAEMGFDARWGVLGAAHFGAPHLRERIWIVAKAATPERRPQRGAHLRLAREVGVPQREEGAGGLEGGSEDAAYPDKVRELQPEGRQRDQRGWAVDSIEEWAEREQRQWAVEPDVVRMVHGIPHGLDRVGALGNAQVPQCAAGAWRLLSSNYR